MGINQPWDPETEYYISFDLFNWFPNGWQLEIIRMIEVIYPFVKWSLNTNECQTRWENKNTQLTWHWKQNAKLTASLSAQLLLPWWLKHFDGLVQARCNSSAFAMELHLSCTNPFIQSFYLVCLKYITVSTHLHSARLDKWQSQNHLIFIVRIPKPGKIVFILKLSPDDFYVETFTLPLAHRMSTNTSSVFSNIADTFDHWIHWHRWLWRDMMDPACLPACLTVKRYDGHCLPACLPDCEEIWWTLPACLPACEEIWWTLPACLPDWLWRDMMDTACLPAWLTVKRYDGHCLPDCEEIWWTLPACLPVCLPVCLPACLPACLLVRYNSQDKAVSTNSSDHMTLLKSCNMTSYDIIYHK